MHYVESVCDLMTIIYYFLIISVAANLQKIQDNPDLKNVTFALVSQGVIIELKMNDLLYQGMYYLSTVDS